MGTKPLTGLIGVFSIGILLTGCNCCRQGHKTFANGTADGSMGLTNKWNTRPQGSQLAGGAGASGNTPSSAGTSGSLSSQVSGSASEQGLGSTSKVGSSSASSLNGTSSSSFSGIPFSPAGSMTPPSSAGSMTPPSGGSSLTSPSGSSSLTSPSGSSGLTSPSGSGKTPSLSSDPTGPGLGMSKPSSLGSDDGLSSAHGIQQTSLTNPSSGITPSGEIKTSSRWSDSPSVRDAAYQAPAPDASATMGANKPSHSLTVPAAPTPSSLAPSSPAPSSATGTKASSSSSSMPDATPSNTEVPSSSPSSGSGSSKKSPEPSSWPPYMQSQSPGGGM